MSTSQKTTPTVSIHDVSETPSFVGSAASSVRNMDIEKTEDYLENDAQGLTHYVVPVLEKGVKTVRKEPPSAFIRFRIWYNPYRMVSVPYLSYLP